MELMGGRSVGNWIDRKLKRGTFELRGDVIIRGRGASAEDSLHVSDIESWTNFEDAWIYVVPVRLRDGRVINWVDPYCQLECILRQVAADKEIVGS